MTFPMIRKHLKNIHNINILRLAIYTQHRSYYFSKSEIRFIQVTLDIDFDELYEYRKSRLSQGISVDWMLRKPIKLGKSKRLWY